MPVQQFPLEKSTSPVVALHSSASNAGQWQQLVKDLENWFEVITPGLPGYVPTSSSKKPVGDASQQIIADIEKLGEAVHLVGHSNGGAIALQVAIQRPDLISSLTLYEPAAFHILKSGDERNRRLGREIQQLSGIMTASAAVGDPDRGMEAFIDFWNGNGSWTHLNPAARAKFSGMITSVMRDFTEGFAQTWTLDDLAELDFPTLVMMGLESPLVAQRVSVEIAHAIPEARIALLPELNHMAPVFQPEWVNPRILEHLSNAERPQRAFNWPGKWAA